MSDAAIEVLHLGKTYLQPRTMRQWLQRRTGARAVLALDDISFSVAQGEVLGLLGANGAGKTTLINVLCTLLTPSAGSARIGGIDVTLDPQRARRQVGLVTSNERSFYWRLTGRQNLRFFGDLYHVPADQIDGRIAEFIDALDLREFADRRFDGYSTGIRQRFAFARAMLHHPRILFMDEPTKGLDPNASATLLQVIRERIVEVWRPTIVVTSHNLVEIEKLCRRVAIVDRGRLLRIGTIDELARSIRSHQAYLLHVGGAIPGEAAPATALTILSGLVGADRLRVRDDRGPGTWLELGLVEGGVSLTQALAALIGQGLQLLRCEPLEVSLEDVFRQTVAQRGAV